MTRDRNRGFGCDVTRYPQVSFSASLFASYLFPGGYPCLIVVKIPLRAKGFSASFELDFDSLCVRRTHLYLLRLFEMFG